MANTVANLTAVLQMNNTKFKQGLSQSEKALRAFKTQMAALSGVIAGVFSVQAITRFSVEAFKLSAAAQGIEAAFSRVSFPGLLEDLQKATAGTVSDLNLMKRAVMASNFKIPLEQLASLLNFATKRAQETGQSVDHLVESIVLGIGRKSPLILDNLGISAVELRQKLKGAGVELTSVMEVARAVGEIAQEEMAKSGVIIETTVVKVERLKTAFQNAQKAFGDFITGSTGIDQKLRDLSSKLDVLFIAFKPDFFSGGQGAMDNTLGWLSRNEDVIHTIPRDLEQAQLNLKELFKTDASFNFKSSGLWAMSEAIGEMGGTGGPSGPHPTPTMPGVSSYLSNLPAFDPTDTEFMDHMAEYHEWMGKLSNTLDDIDDTEEDISETQEEITAVGPWKEWAKAIAEGNTNLEKTKWELMTIEQKAESVGRGFAALGQTINQIAKGAEQSFEDTAQTLLDTIGQVLISIGGWAALVGGILVGGSALWDAFEATDAATVSGGSSGGGTGTVTFKIEGRDLVGVLNTEQAVRGITT